MARRRLLRFWLYAIYNGVSYDETVTVSSFDATGGTANITIVSSAPWVIESHPNWITINQADGEKGNINIVLTASANTDTQGKSGSIVIKTKNNKKSIQINCSIQGSGESAVTYVVALNVNSPSIAYNGTTQFSVFLNKYVGGTLSETTDITQTATLTSDGSISVSQNDRTITGTNTTNYDATGTISASYTVDGKTIESTVTTINVAAKPIYELSIIPSDDILWASGDTATLTANYITIINGTTASTTDVTSSTQFEITSGNRFATLYENIVTSNNSGTTGGYVDISGTYGTLSATTTIHVLGNDPEPDIYINPTEVTIAYNQYTGTDLLVAVGVTGQTWSASTTSPWVNSITPSTGSSSSYVSIRFNTNTGNTPNTIEIVFHGSVSGSKTLTVTQNAQPLVHDYYLAITDASGSGYPGYNSFTVYADDTQQFYTCIKDRNDDSISIPVSSVWSSDDDDVFTVDSSGEVTFKGGGYTNLNAEYTYDGQRLTAYITINVVIKEHTFTISPSTVTLSNTGTSAVTFTCRYDGISVSPNHVTFILDSDIAQYASLSNGRLTLTDSPTVNDVYGDVTASYEGLSDTCHVTILHESVAPTLVSIDAVISSVPDIPASGGSVDCSKAALIVTAHYSDGTSEPISGSSYNIDSCTPVTADTKGTTISDITSAGTLSVSVSYEGKTATTSTTVYQEENEIVTTGSSRTQSGSTEETGRTDGSTSYSIEVVPSSSSVTYGGGYINIAVNGSAITPYTAYTASTTYYVVTDWSAYTSTQSATTSTTDTETGRTETTGTDISSAACELNSIDGAVITAATTSEIYYNQNDSSSVRTGYVTYKISGTTVGPTATFTLTQGGKPAPTDREITLSFPENGTFENDSNQGTPIIITNMSCVFSYNNNEIFSSDYVGVLNPANDIQYPFGNDWSEEPPQGGYTITIPYNTTSIIIDIKIDGVRNEGQQGGAPYSTSITLSNITLDKDHYTITSLPDIVYQNQD